MPKISDERRAERRLQILTAAWSCFQDRGLHETTMHDIIRVSGLSAGAVYGYFNTKEDLILTAITTSLAELSERLRPLLFSDPPPAPTSLVRQVTAEVAGFAEREGYDLKRIALLGWSEAQRNQRIHEAMRTYYGAVRDRLVAIAEGWKKAGVIAPDADTDAVAKMLLSSVLGFVVQETLIGGMRPETLASGIDALRQAK